MSVVPCSKRRKGIRNSRTRVDARILLKWKKNYLKIKLVTKYERKIQDEGNKEIPP